MNFEEVKQGKSKEFPTKVVLYGVPKIGKSRFCADMDDPFYIDVEGGLQYIGKEVRSTPTLEKFDDVMAWLMHILESEDFTAGTLVFDSLDWLESLARQKIEALHGGTSISDQSHKAFAYGAGTAMVAEETIRVFRAADAIYKKKGIKAVFIAHSQVRSLDLPTKDPYSRYEMKVSKALNAKANEWADLILFADYSFHITKDGKTSEPKPVLLTGGSASFVGGGRMQLSKEIPLNFENLKKELEQ